MRIVRLSSHFRREVALVIAAIRQVIAASYSVCRGK